MGIFGLILNIIFLLISSFFPCGETYYSSKFCSSVKNSADKNDTYYFDNFLNYISRIRDDLFPKDKDIKRRRSPKHIIAEIICSFIMSGIGFAKMRIDLFIIEILGVFYLLIPEVIYQFMVDFYIIIYKFVNNIIDKTQIIQFIFIIISNLFALIGILIYLELIELRFCKLDKNINKNISLRAKEDEEDPEDLEEISEIKPFPIRDSLLDKNNED